MHLTQIPLRAEKLKNEKGISILLNAGSSESEIREAELRLDLRFPEQVKLFYCNFNGLQVSDPTLDVLSLARLSLRAPKRLHFAVFDGEGNVYFDISNENAAGQWNIVSEDGYVITFSMASFWSNKIWRWIEYRKPVWTDFETPPRCDL